MRRVTLRRFRVPDAHAAVLGPGDGEPIPGEGVQARDGARVSLQNAQKVSLQAPHDGRPVVAGREDAPLVVRHGDARHGSRVAALEDDLQCVGVDVPYCRIARIQPAKGRLAVLGQMQRDDAARVGHRIAGRGGRVGALDAVPHSQIAIVRHGINPLAAGACNNLGHRGRVTLEEEAGSARVDRDAEDVAVLRPRDRVLAARRQNQACHLRVYLTRVHRPRRHQIPGNELASLGRHDKPPVRVQDHVRDGLVRRPE